MIFEVVKLVDWVTTGHPEYAINSNQKNEIILERKMKKMLHQVHLSKGYFSRNFPPFSVK